jgi:hypothetical protein
VAEEGVVGAAHAAGVGAGGAAPGAGAGAGREIKKKFKKIKIANFVVFENLVHLYSGSHTFF